jgi:hypothetical protein
MGLIFRDERDDQQEALMQTTAVGLTWQYRYLTMKWMFYTMMAGLGSGATMAIVDYTIFQTTDYSGLVDWALSTITGN